MFRRVLVIFFCALCCVRAGAAQTVEAKIAPPTAGDRTIRGFVLPAQTSAAGFVLEVSLARPGGEEFVDRVDLGKFEPNGAFSVELRAAAVAGQRIRLLRGRTVLPGGSVEVKPAEAVTAARLNQVRIGDQRVSGRVVPSDGPVNGLSVSVDSDGKPVGTYAVTSIDDGGGFAVILTQPLAPGQRVSVGIGGKPLGDVTVPPAPTTKYRLLPAFAGETTVAGVLTPVPKEPKAFRVEVTSAKVLAKPPKAIAEVNEATGAFSVTLDSPLMGGDSVSVNAEGEPATVTPFASRTNLRDGLYDGSRIVRGVVDSRRGLAAVRVRVLRSGLENQFVLGATPGADGAAVAVLERYVQIKDAPVDGLSATGEFTVNLESPLVAGQIVVAEALTSAGERGPSSERVTVVDPGNWGRARAYFAGGIVFAKDREDFSKQDLSLTLAIDKSVLQKADFQLAAERAVVDDFVARQLSAACRAATIKSPDTCGDEWRQLRNDPRLKARGKFTFRQLNSFFDARLTQLPVVEPAAAAEAPETTANGSPTTGFRDSRKAAWMQVGMYAPVYGPQTSWVHDGAVNSIFVAPLFRYAISTIAGRGDGEPTKNARGEADDVFHSYGLGFALGHHKLSGTTNQTPELISYLGIVWGHSEAFQYADTTLDAAAPPGNSGRLCKTKYSVVGGQVLVNPCRVMVEGRLKIPNTAFQVGFNADLGDGHDDLRFIFGTRFDIGEAFARLRKFDF